MSTTASWKHILILGAACLPFLRPAAATAGPRLLVSLTGHEESFGLINDPTHITLDYVLELLTDGTFRAAIVGREDQGELDPPDGGVLSRRPLSARELRTIRRQIAAARLGARRNCTTDVPFIHNSLSSPRQRLNWFGVNGRRNSLELFTGPQCDASLVALLESLRTYFVTSTPAQTANAD